MLDRSRDRRYILFLHTFIACLIAACHGCAKTNTQDSDTFYMSIPANENPDKVWLFAVDGRKRPYSFLDSNGLLVGFDVDIIAKVCELAGRQCKMVLAEFSECTMTDRDINYAGRGLMSGWFDACPGYVVSVDRFGAFEFSQPYLDTAASFTVKPGNPSGFDPNLKDYSKFVFTHLNGAVTNSKCLTRLKKKFGTIIVAKDLPEAKALLLNETANVLFSPRTRISDLEVLPDRVHCDTGGAAMMVKKGSSLPTWWNPAFNKFVKSGGYDALCASSQLVYNATVKCLSQGVINHQATMSSHSLIFHGDEKDKKVWLFAVSGRRKPFNFLDEEGRLTGFDVNFVDMICLHAKKNCMVVLTEFTECTFTERNINYPGRGLMDGWIDACTGYADSLDRENGFDFTDAYLLSDASFTVTPGNPSGFDPSVSDYSNFTFTHLTGAYTNAACLNRLKKKFGKIIIAANLPEAKQLLSSRKADVLFSPRSRIPDLETLPARVHCERSGTAMMAKKGSPLVHWFNRAFHQTLNNSFDSLCHWAVRRYNYPFRCKGI